MNCELFGPPGSGKTYYIKHYYRKQITLTRIQKIFWFLFSFFKHPLFYTYILKEIFFQKTPLKIYLKKVILLIDFGSRTEYNLNKEGIVEDTLVQYIYSLYDYKITLTKVKKYFTKLFYSPKKILIFEIPDELRIKRQIERKRFSRRQYGEKYFMRWRNVSKSNYKIIVKYIKQTFNYDIFY